MQGKPANTRREGEGNFCVESEGDLYMMSMGNESMAKILRAMSISARLRSTTRHLSRFV